VPWQACLEISSTTSESVEVLRSHTGLGHDPAAMWVVADRLALPKMSGSLFGPTGKPVCCFHPSGQQRSDGRIACELYARLPAWGVPALTLGRNGAGQNPLTLVMDLTTPTGMPAAPFEHETNPVEIVKIKSTLGLPPLSGIRPPRALR
jgi:hypothetical protein